MLMYEFSITIVVINIFCAVAPGEKKNSLKKNTPSCYSGWFLPFVFGLVFLSLSGFCFFVCLFFFSSSFKTDFS